MIKQLQAVAEALTNLAVAMEVEAITKGNLTFDGKERPAEPEETAAPWQESKASAVSEITFEKVRAALAKKSSMGYSTEIKKLLQKHGADKLSEVNQSDYAALLADAEVL